MERARKRRGEREKEETERGGQKERRVEEGMKAERTGEDGVREKLGNRREVGAGESKDEKEAGKERERGEGKKRRVETETERQKDRQKRQADTQTTETYRKTERSGERDRNKKPANNIDDEEEDLNRAGHCSPVPTSDQVPGHVHATHARAPRSSQTERSAGSGRGEEVDHSRRSGSPSRAGPSGTLTEEAQSEVTRTVPHMEHKSWGYGETDGPSTWPSKFPKAGGCRQSPVDIQRTRTVYDSSLSDQLLKVSYREEENLRLGNNGHTVKADCAQESTLTGGPLGNKVYKLAQFHLHWGAKNDRGSEHTVDGKQYAAEIHLVHWNSTKYENFDEACKESDGLAVLCVLIKIGSKHQGFDIVSRQLKNVAFKDDSFKLDVSFDPSCLLPSDTSRFWTYPGSLTTPPCYESVQFIVFEEVAQFSLEQIKALRSLYIGDTCGAHLEDNYRPTCDLGGRTVLSSFQS